MDTIMDRAVTRLVERARGDPEVLAVILFGSRARGDAAAGSDVDVCLVLGAEPESALAGARKRLDHIAGSDLDVVIFQQLPLHVRTRVLKDGVILFVRDEDALYALAIKTVRAFERFQPIYRQYLDQVARG